MCVTFDRFYWFSRERLACKINEKQVLPFESHLFLIWFHRIYWLQPNSNNRFVTMDVDHSHFCIWSKSNEKKKKEEKRAIHHIINIRHTGEQQQKKLHHSDCVATWFELCTSTTLVIEFEIEWCFVQIFWKITTHCGLRSIRLGHLYNKRWTLNCIHIIIFINSSSSSIKLEFEHWTLSIK